MGWENVFHCEWNDFGQKVLKHYWPKAESFGDITKTDFTKYHGTIDIISGGFPCQPYSTAGKRKGKEDERHLWPEMLRAIREIHPRWVVGENVLGLVNWSGGLVFHEVQTDLEAQGYEVFPYVLPACAVNAPHERYRIWFVAYSDSKRLQKSNCKLRQINGVPKKTPSFFTGNTFAQWDIRKRSSGMLRKCDGLPTELDGITFPKWRNESIKAYGNAVVPQVVYQVFKAIHEYELSYGCL
jgi:DNA (cytosine-5)-methyltransferase 1